MCVFIMFVHHARVVFWRVFFTLEAAFEQTKNLNLLNLCKWQLLIKLFILHALRQSTVPKNWDDVRVQKVSSTVQHPSNSPQMEEEALHFCCPWNNWEGAWGHAFGSVCLSGRTCCQAELHSWLYFYQDRGLSKQLYSSNLALIRNWPPPFSCLFIMPDQFHIALLYSIQKLIIAPKRDTADILSITASCGRQRTGEH